MGVIGIADRQRENLGVALDPGVTLTTIDPVVDVVGLFEIQPGLLRINRDYGWLRAADLMAEGDPDLLADMAAATHDLITARLQAWHVEEGLWSAGVVNPAADVGTLALLRDLKVRVIEAVECRKQLGFPVPEGCEAWWSDYEVHTGERPANLPPCPSRRG